MLVGGAANFYNDTTGAEWNRISFRIAPFIGGALCMLNENLSTTRGMTLEIWKFFY